MTDKRFRSRGKRERMRNNARQEASPKNSSLEKKGGGAPRGAPPGRIDKRCGARPFSCLPTVGRTEAALTSWSGRARLSAPHRGIRGLFGPRLGLGRASWNHRMQTGGPSPAPVQRAPRGPARAGRDDAQAARERSVSLRPREPPPLRLKEYPRERRPSRAGCWLGNRCGDGCQERCRLIRDILWGGLA
jgi:hypothetical protein